MKNKDLEKIMTKAEIEYENMKDTIHEQYDTLKKIKQIVNNDKVSGIEAKLMIKDILEGKKW